ncbi:lysozyme inhibitor LprI family protein [Erwinia oleae]|uniref:lysozyme inhibitor LprI family protein n=1 Tax=Erwinia oleae TaxID=796334 RepID=UPI0005590E79|nr:lysozyme inhibitor LprI family protein [Erwinia oleae]
MRKLFAIACVLYAASGHAETNPIDTAQAACLDKANTTVDMQQCYSEAGSAWDKEMNQQYSTLLATLDKTQKAKLREAQRAWLTYRDSWLAASRERMRDGGTLATVSLGAQRVELIRNQVQALKSLASGSCANPDDC